MRVIGGMFRGALLAVLGLAVTFVLGAVLLASAASPDLDAPPQVRPLLPEAKRHLTAQFDAWNSIVRYIGIETRERDHLVIMQFEIRSFPFLGVDRAYLVSRCVPIEELDPAGMGGGRGVVDYDSDPELQFLRSDAQPAC